MDTAFQKNGHLCFRALLSYAEWVLHRSILMLADKGFQKPLLLSRTCWGTCGRCLWWQQWPPGPHSWPWSGWGLAVCSHSAPQIAREEQDNTIKTSWRNTPSQPTAHTEEQGMHMRKGPEGKTKERQLPTQYVCPEKTYRLTSACIITVEISADSSSCKK